jgi:16S rRNA (cytosine967-C5)-methyltransferase
MTLMDIYRGAYADVALHNHLRNISLQENDRALATELVYGCVRRQYTLDTLIQQLSSKPQPPSPDLRAMLHLGLYQLRYLSHIPPAAAVHSTVELCKALKVSYGVGFVNAVLRHYLRLQAAESEVLQLPSNPLDRLGVLHSYPRWILEVWATQLQIGNLQTEGLQTGGLQTGDIETGSLAPETLEDLEKLCEWLNTPPRLDLRVNPLRATVDQVRRALSQGGIEAEPIPGLPQGLALPGAIGAIPQLPGFQEGQWMVQDRSAQLVSHWLDPQPGETIVDACAAPGGKTLHLAELMQNQGKIFAYDRTASRLKKLEQNLKRLGLTSVQVCQGDSRHQPDLKGQCDRVLVDAPCSGLGTLHRHADARWTQTPETIQDLSQLQGELLRSAATWVKPGGVLVYATCTLHPAENEDQIERFLQDHPHWTIELPPIALAASGVPWALSPTVPSKGLKLWPHQAHMDGFFMVRLRHD